MIIIIKNMVVMVAAIVNIVATAIAETRESKPSRLLRWWRRKIEAELLALICSWQRR